MSGSRKLALDILEQVFNKGAYSNIFLNQSLNKSDLNDKDKALTTEIVYGTIKFKYTIDKILKYYLKDKMKKIDNVILNILRTAIYQIRFLDKIPEFAAVNEAVKLAKKYRSIGESKLVNGVLRNYLRSSEENYYNDKDKVEELSFKYSFEPWMVKMFIKQYGEETTHSILQGLNKVPEVTIRVNSLKSDYDTVFHNLQSNGYIVSQGAVCPEAISIAKGGSIEANPLFKEGFFTVQDESAMLVAPSLELEKNMNVFDLCSAPGGKTTHISEIMNDTGSVTAFDIHENKLSLIEDNRKRLGIKNLTCKAMDATVFDENLANKADRVLLDVPCSGLGIIRKKPEIKWSKDSTQLNELLEIQRKILTNGASYVKPGGKMVYSTCTLNKKENEENIKWFLKKFSNFTIEPLQLGIADNIKYNKDNSVTILPNENMDGFFIAKLTRQR